MAAVPGLETVHWLEVYGASGSVPVVRAGVCEGGAVGALVLARPAARNAWDGAMWAQWDAAVAALRALDSVRVVVLCAEGPAFTGGLDLGYLAATLGRHTAGGSDPARARARFLREIAAMQAAYSALEAAPWPVIAAVHGACVGAGVDLVTACDLRYATRDAYFCVKEVDVGITADLGTLQRLPAIVGQGAAADMALTARRVSGEEAAALGLVSRCFAGRAEMMEAVLGVARDIAAKSPLAVWGTKRTLLRARDGGSGVADGLDRVALHNAAFLLGADIRETVAARSERRPPRFSKL
ncbi:hypothetical protein Rsub_10309 [Raphidocelis subcapitata]|uniref:Uncharacterized protein n=1 Tax=Raphidocelis subcapitata TaxID=307507 RepID=A0A2V0PDZ9_9CHLO|nr:hypothetical protein Rsub_10309 [Raphidocelis subcapitata]|eukprot:GBF98081.1 hypothetical protein Rsub_10309 [Raphidocelis subcapitata]